MSKEYGNDSIRSLSDREAVRLRPANILGSDDINGFTHSFIEILGNALDEAKGGFGNTITVTKYKDSSLSVEDFGRGVPMAYNESEGEYNYKLVFSKLHSGGKYTKDEDDAYADAIGLSGLGASATHFSSEYFYVRSRRDGHCYEANSKDGEFSGELKEVKEDYDSTGTFIKWKGSLDVFTDVDIPIDVIKTICKEQAIVNKGIKLIVNDESTEEVFDYVYNNGIIDYIEEYVEETSFTDTQYWESKAKGKDHENRKEYSSKYQIAFCFSNEKPMLKSYHNSSYLKHGGSPHDGIKSAFTYAIDKLIKSKNKYNKGEKKVSWDSIADSLCIISNTYSTETSYMNQTKFSITNRFIKEYMDKYLREQLEIYFIENPLEADKIVEQVLINKRASEKAEQTKLNIKKKLQGNISSIDNRVNGFINCKSKDKSKNILTICEGKSSLSAMLSGRQNIHAIFPIRGKILNCLKASVDEILKNDVISNLIKVMGCGIEIGGKKKGENFNIENLNFHRIDIYVDSDLDGIGSILPLLLTVFWKLTPTLVKEGRINLVGTPKYEVLYGNDEFLYAINDRELEDIKDKLNGQKYEIHYIKGLAELSSEAMAMCLHPDYKNITQITLEDIEESIRTLELYMGSDVTPRRLKILSSFEEDAV